MDQIGYFLSNVFPIHMFFAIQILIAEMMFVVSAEKRKKPVVRIPICIALYLLLTFFHPLMGDKFIRVLFLFAWSLLFVYVVVDASLKTCLFIGIASYAIQNLAFNIGSLFILLFHLSSGSFLYYFVAAICFTVVYTICYFVFVRRFKTEKDLLIKNTTVLILAIVTIAVVYSKNVLISWGVMNHEELLSVFTSISCILTLILQFGLLRHQEVIYQNQVVEQLLKSEKERFETLKETMDIVNMKCHDLRFNIRQYRQNQADEKHGKFFEELEDSISIYDNISRTGNSAVDTILSEKLIYCHKNGIQVSYVVDASALEPIEISDVYSLFGNAMDNAVRAVMSETEEKRFISVIIRKKGMFTHIGVDNTCLTSPEMKDGLPVSKQDKRYHGYGMKSMVYIAEKYQGNLTADYTDGMFHLGILLRPSENHE